MDIRKFIEEQHKKLDSFEANWEKNHRKHPDQFPVELSPDDWSKQYLAWCQVTNPKESTR